MSLIFFDFETTGLSPSKDKITQFMFLNSSTQECCASYVNPEQNVPPECVKLNGITWDDLKAYPTFKNKCNTIMSFLGTNKPVYLVAHNGDSFDKVFLFYEMKRNNMEIPSNWFFIDTLKLARHFLPQLPNHKMDTLREYYHFSKDHAHLATKDVLDLEKIYSCMAGEETPHAMYLLNKELSQIMPFGKYKGEALRNIPKDYFGFLLSKKIITEEKNYDLIQNLRKIHV